jgi:hypothetical protein
MCLSVPSNPGSLNVQDELSQPERGALSTRSGKHIRSRSRRANSRTGLVSQQGYRRLQARARTPSVLPVIPLPDVFLKYENLFTDIPIYINGMMGNRMWILDHFGFLRNIQRSGRDPIDLCHLCVEAADAFKMVAAVRGRLLLSRAFSLLPRILREKHPRMLEVTMVTLSILKRESFVGICAMLQDYIVQLSRTILPRGHIWQQICILISTQDPEQAEVIIRS